MDLSLPSFDPRQPFVSFTAMIDALLLPTSDLIMGRIITEIGPLAHVFGTIALLLVGLGLGRGLTRANAADYGSVVIRFAFISVILSAGVYSYWVRDAVIIAAPNFFTAAVGAAEGASGGAYDLLLNQMLQAGWSVMNSFSTYNPLKAIVLIFWGIGGAAIIAGYGIWLLGHFMAVMYVSVGAIFISLAFFKPLRPIASAWMGATLSTVVLQGMSLILSVLLVGVQQGVLVFLTARTEGDAYVKISALVSAAVIFVLCGWWAKRLPAAAASLCGGVHFSPTALTAATYDKVSSGVMQAISFSAEKGKQGAQAVYRRATAPAALTPPGPSLTKAVSR